MLKLLLAILKLFPPKPLLRFLLWVDRWLYYLQGQVAGWYGQGVHPKHRLMDYHRFFISRIQHSDHVLDIGCGIGAVAYDVAVSTGASVIGIDINEKNSWYRYDLNTMFEHIVHDFHDIYNITILSSPSSYQRSINHSKTKDIDIDRDENDEDDDDDSIDGPWIIQIDNFLSNDVLT